MCNGEGMLCVMGEEGEDCKKGSAFIIIRKCQTRVNNPQWHNG